MRAVMRCSDGAHRQGITSDWTVQAVDSLSSSHPPELVPKTTMSLARHAIQAPNRFSFFLPNTPGDEPADPEAHQFWPSC